MQAKIGNFARVVIPNPIKEPLVYKIPAHLGDLRPGTGVVVPVGRRRMTGVVLDFISETSLTEVKEIVDVVDPSPVLDASLLDLGRWVSQYYLAPLGVVFSALLPPTLKRGSPRLVFPHPGEFPGIGKVEREILEEARKKKSRLTLRSLSKKFAGRNLHQALERLAEMGAVEIRERRRQAKKNPPDSGLDSDAALLEGHAAPPPRLNLTEEQEAALSRIRERLEKGGFETFLLYGVTGSGKTEVYLRAMEEAKKRRRRSLILIPEISLTPQLLDRLQQRFPNRVGVLHSALTPAERWSQWRQILRGAADVIVGARSAVFAPVPDLGLIIVDEEHDSSYKQDDGLCYHARDLSVVRGKLAGCPVVLGSATPSLESFTNAAERRYQLLDLPGRVEQKAMPVVEIVDLREKEGAEEPWSAEGRSFFSPLLGAALQENHARGHQSLIFLNRRGFANFLQCRLCGFVLRCPNCSVTMTFHFKQRRVTCHHCGSSRFAGDDCPSCGNPSLAGIGFGTEKIESDLQRILPGARIARMDRDTTGKRGSQERIIRQWEKGEIDVLVGTQMITKGHDVGRVTLVGAILADLSLSVPDFRAAERTFQLLCQVAGRAGRGEEPGRVIVQTYNPDHYALRHLITHDYRAFYDAEIEFRRDLGYPPFSGLVLIRLDGLDAKKVESQAKALGEELRRRQKEKIAAFHGIEILGPAPAPIEKLRNRHRWQLLLKGKRGKSLLEMAQSTKEILRPSRVLRLHIDVDPNHML